MTGISCKKPMVCLALFLALGMAAPSDADWSLEFESPLPATVSTRDITASGAASPTFAASVDAGILALGDTTATNSGGAGVVLLWDDEEFFDVRVTGTINPDGSARDFVGLTARGNAGLSNGYGVGVNFSDGTLFAGKVVNDGIPFSVFSNAPDQGNQAPLTDLSRSYYLVNEVIGNEITGRLFDVAGGTELLTVSFTDTGDIAGAPYADGVSGVFAFQFPTPTSAPLNATFDDVGSAAVPEPATLLLLAIGSFGLLRWRSLNRKGPSQFRVCS